MSILSEFLHSHAPQNGWGTFFAARLRSLRGCLCCKSRSQQEDDCCRVKCFECCTSVVDCDSQHRVSLQAEAGRLRVPKIGKENWSYPEKMGLMPKEDGYSNWLRGFPPHPTRRQRLLARLPVKRSTDAKQDGMCNLYSITTNQTASIALWRPVCPTAQGTSGR
jgi:hypothetical protein